MYKCINKMYVCKNVCMYIYGCIRDYFFFQQSGQNIWASATFIFKNKEYTHIYKQMHIHEIVNYDMH